MAVNNTEREDYREDCSMCYAKKDGVFMAEHTHNPTPQPIEDWEDALSPKVVYLQEKDEYVAKNISIYLEHYWEVLKPHISSLLTKAREDEREKMWKEFSYFRNNLRTDRDNESFEELLNSLNKQ